MGANYRLTIAGRITEPEVLSELVSALKADFVYIGSQGEEGVLNRLAKLRGERRRKLAYIDDSALGSVDRIVAFAIRRKIDMRFDVRDALSQAESTFIIKDGKRFTTFKRIDDELHVAARSLPDLMNECGIQTVPQLWAYLSEYNTEAWRGFEVDQTLLPMRPHEQVGKERAA